VTAIYPVIYFKNVAVVVILTAVADVAIVAIVMTVALLLEF
jgi:hypothetical protein